MIDRSIIEIRNIAKKYRINTVSSYASLREELVNFFNPFRGRDKLKAQYIWSLKDISFSIKEGESLGVIGANGAGKSTLLKILSRVTFPTEGEILIRGRVSSLLEVGTGFHPELTGKENIFLNGAVLGMKKTEISKQFENIVEFAGVENFLDTPVKHYSSGMYTRLAFSVAAHLEPEIIIIDEVLALGDAAFQKKSLEKIGEIGRKGKTVIFVSHNMSSIAQICNKVVLLDKGRIVLEGRPDKVIKEYLTGKPYLVKQAVDLTKDGLLKHSLGKDKLILKSIKIENSKNRTINDIEFGEPFSIVVEVNVLESKSDCFFAFGITSPFGFPLFNSYSTDSGISTILAKGKHRFKITIYPNTIAPGMYKIDLAAYGKGINQWIPEAINLNILSFSSKGDAIRSTYAGVFVPQLKWIQR